MSNRTQSPSPAVLTFTDAIYWPLKRVRRSAWLSHTPFAFWMIAALRPSRLVELGTHNGVSFCAFCQAIKELEVDCEAVAVDTWQGDPHAGFYGEEVFDDLLAYQREHYGTFSRLQRSSFDEARPQFETGSIDLLHIDGLHTYEAVRHDFETWKSALSANGVVMFHDTEERRADFGVYRLFEELSRQYGSFSFLHGHGLGILMLGQCPSEPLQRLIEAQGNPSDQRRICHTFERLGAAFVHEGEIQRLNSALEVYADQIRTERSRAESLSRSAQLVEILKHQVEIADQANKLAHDELKSVTAKFEEIDRERNQLRSALKAAQAEAKQWATDLDQTRDELRKSTDCLRLATEKVAFDSEQIAALEQQTESLVVKLAELGALTNKLNADAETKRQPPQAEPAFVKVRRRRRAWLPKSKIEKLLSRSVSFLLRPTISGRRRHKLKRRAELLREIAFVQKSELFDPAYYYATYRDVRDAGIDPALHFCTHGWREGRWPSEYFNTVMYLQTYTDVAAAEMNPLVHYLRHGKAEGRSTNPHGGIDKCHAGLKLPRKMGKLGSTSPLKARLGGGADVENAFGPIFDPDWDSRIPILRKILDCGKLISGEVPYGIKQAAHESLARKQPSISVIMPAWNREGSVCKAIDSVLHQSYPPAELIVTDDGSTDRTCVTIEERFKAELASGKIRLLRNPHGGVSAARNAGLKAARGELIAYLDSDNTWRPDHLLVMAAAFCENDELMTAYAALESHDADTGREIVRAAPYNRLRLLDSNFIDLNVFVHRRQLFDQFGGFDTTLKRLVDWELIIRYTKLYPPAFIPIISVDYFLDNKRLKNITTTVTLHDNKDRVYQRHFSERARYGLEPLRIGYLIYDWPALSQTFVMNELRWLLGQGFDVKVYYVIDPERSAKLDFEIESFRVKDADEFAERLLAHNRNLCHSHFVYPGVTNFVWPACEKAKIPFTFIPHAVDLFHISNRKRHRVGEIANSPQCMKVFVYGDHHKQYLDSCGVPTSKIAYNFQAVDLSEFAAAAACSSTFSTEKSGRSRTQRGLVIARFIEKKGIEYLIEAAAALKDRYDFEVNLFGYGPLETDYRKAIAKHGLERRFHLCGTINSQDELTKAYAAADFLVAPSVVASNGDMDGFPTVILEAMAARKPVVTTAVSAVPDYLTDGIEAIVVPPRDVAALSLALEQVLTMSPARRSAMIQRAEYFLARRIGVEQTMSVYLDCWQNKPIDIFLVTFNTAKSEDRKETFEIIRRVLTHTTTPFNLTIIDNRSDDDFWHQLQEQVRGNTNVRMIRKDQNQFCGPASNIALRVGDARYAIYLCSKEGFVAHHGWERTLINYMDRNLNVAIAGHLCHQPRFVYGAELTAHPDFRNFRNQDFAQHNPNRAFTHIQGGLFILRRDVYAEVGGFNDATPQNNTDVELSYYLESQGKLLGKIPEVVSLTTKTLPPAMAQLTEQTVAAHPFTVDSASQQLDVLCTPNYARCNLCGWNGRQDDFVRSTAEGRDPPVKCPNCSSSGLGRMLYAHLASDRRAHRGSILAALIDDDKLVSTLGERMFRLGPTGTTAQTWLRELGRDCGDGIGLMIVNPDLLTGVDDDEAVFWREALGRLRRDGAVVFADRAFSDKSARHSLSVSSHVAATALNGTADQFQIHYCDQQSRALAFDWCRLGVIERLATVR